VGHEGPTIRGLAVFVGLVVLLILCGPSTNARGRPKTDVVTLDNGDRITGETKKLDRGILTFKTDALDTVTIEWERVVEIVSDFDFEFRALDGMLYFGNLEQPTEPGTLVIGTEQGPLEMPLSEITQLLPIEASFWARLDGSLSLSFDAASSSEVSHLTTGADATYRTKKWESTVDLLVIVNKQEPEDTSRESLSFNSLRKWRKRRFTGAVIQAEGNEELGLDLRLLAGGFAGRDVIEATHSRLRLSGGLMVNREEREGQTDAETSFEAAAALSYDLFRFKHPETDLHFETIFFHNLSESERLRAEASVSLEYEIFNDFDWVLTAYDSYESDPVTADTERHDWGVFVSFAWDF